MTLAALLAEFPQVRLAREEDNQAILALVQNNPMSSQKQQMIFEREPRFFSLLEAQGEKVYPFVFLQQNGSISGTGSITLSRWMVGGQEQWVAYQSDLRHSANMEKATKLQFYRFFEELMRNFPQIEEFSGCQISLAAILDGNLRAKRALVEAKSRRASQVLQHPLYPYETINVLAQIKSLKHKALRVEKWGARAPEPLIQFLMAGSRDVLFIPTQKEVERRLRALSMSWADFTVVFNQENELQACCLVATDVAFRRPRLMVKNLSLSILSQLGRRFGQPAWDSKQPLRVGHLALLKWQDSSSFSSDQILGVLLDHILREQRTRPLDHRYHTLSFQVPQGSDLKRRLLWRGFLSVGLPATLYQVLHQARQASLSPLTPTKDRPVFDFLFH